MNTLNRSLIRIVLVCSAAALAGCNYTLVKDPPTAPANVVGHCHGTDSVDDSSVAVVPIPIVAFVSPHAELNQVNPEEYLDRCGASQQLANRYVTLDKNACIPASVTEILTLGIWQWCPASIAWSADVTAATVPPVSYVEPEKKTTTTTVTSIPPSPPNSGDLASAPPPPPQPNTEVDTTIEQDQ